MHQRKKDSGRHFILWQARRACHAKNSKSHFSGAIAAVAHKLLPSDDTAALQRSITTHPIKSNAFRGIEQHLLSPQMRSKRLAWSKSLRTASSPFHRPLGGAIFGPLQPPPEERASAASKVQRPKKQVVNSLIPSGDNQAMVVHEKQLQRPPETPS